MNKMNKHKIYKNEFRSTIRHNKHIEEMILNWMEIQDCDRATAVREMLTYFMELGGVDLIK